MGQQFAQLAFGAQFDLGGVVLRLQTQASLPSIDARGFSYVADRSGVVDTADLGQQSSRGLEAHQRRRRRTIVQNEIGAS